MNEIRATRGWHLDVGRFEADRITSHRTKNAEVLKVGDTVIVNASIWQEMRVEAKTQDGTLELVKL